MFNPTTLITLGSSGLAAIAYGLSARQFSKQKEAYDQDLPKLWARPRKLRKPSLHLPIAGPDCNNPQETAKRPWLEDASRRYRQARNMLDQLQGRMSSRSIQDLEKRLKPVRDDLAAMKGWRWQELGALVLSGSPNKMARDEAFLGPSFPKNQAARNAGIFSGSALGLSGAIAAIEFFKK